MSNCTSLTHDKTDSGIQKNERSSKPMAKPLYNKKTMSFIKKTKGMTYNEVIKAHKKQFGKEIGRATISKYRKKIGERKYEKVSKKTTKAKPKSSFTTDRLRTMYYQEEGVTPPRTMKKTDLVKHLKRKMDESLY